MASNLSDRLRQVVTGSVPRRAPDAAAVLPAMPPTGLVSRDAAAAVGGEWIDRAEGAVILVDRFYPAEARHGRLLVGDITATLEGAPAAMDVFGRTWPAARGIGRGLCFLDLETTGLAGGAGTQAFLVGCAVVEDGGLRVRQFLLPGYEHERTLLADVAAWTAPLGALVTYNGRTFDVPLIETRYLFHRLPFPLADRPHLDMLHAARRLWKARPEVAGPALDGDSCKLTVLERHLAGVHRIGDVPGFEIPSRYFQFVRSGDARPLEAVLEHNRLDLVSLAAVTARALQLVEHGPAATAHPRECLGLGRIYERAGAPNEAEACYAHAAAVSGRVGREPAVRAEALRRLAVCRRRAGRLQDAADAWREIVETPGCPAGLRREAREALAIYHEHRSRNLETARLLVLDVLAEDEGGRLRAAAEHRLRRLEKKLAGREPGGLMAALDDEW